MRSSSLMEGNSKTLPPWDWGNLVAFNGRTSGISKPVQLTDWEIEGGVDSGSIYSSAGGGCSRSDFGHGYSSKSSVSASVDSSSKQATTISKYNSERGDALPKDFTEKKEFSRLEDTDSSPIHGPSVGSGEPVIGLRLGKRTYFEDICIGSSMKTSSCYAAPTPSVTTRKRSRTSCQNALKPQCQVEGCNLNLTSAKSYHRRHRVCESHSKCPKVIIAGLERRFCQQCSRFHDLSEFDAIKRSCRRRLSDHNARRRKPQPGAIQFNSTGLSSSFYDGRHQINLILDGIPLIHSRPAANPTWESTCISKVAKTKQPLMKSEKASVVDRQLCFSNNELPEAISTLHHDSDRLLPFKGITTEVLIQGPEVSEAASGLDASSDLRRALSLLSTSSWGSGDPEPTSLDMLLMRANHTSVAHPVIPVASQSFPLASSGYWQAEHQHTELPMHNNGGGQLQEFHLVKAPCESDLFYSNHGN